MNKDTKVLLMAVVIILVALVSFNLSDLTGMQIRSDVTTLTVSPITTTFERYDTAKMITIRVLPADNGVDKKIEMYKCKNEQCTTSIRLGAETANICTSSTCSEDVTVSYRLDSGLRVGIYYFQAEKDGEKFISNKFEIKHL